MSKPHDLQRLVDEAHIWAEHFLKHGACPSCLAQAMISEGFHLANEAGVLSRAKETADRYADGDGGPVFSAH